MKKTALMLMMVVGIATMVNAQSDYKSGIGVRLGTEYWDLISFSYKGFVTKPGAIEFNAGFGTRSRFSNTAGTISASGSYQHHFDIKPVPGFRWFIGGGLTLANSFYKKPYNDAPDYKGFGFGLFPTGGVDYKFSKIPLAVSADARPTFWITQPGAYNSVYPSVGIAARYTLN